MIPKVSEDVVATIREQFARDELNFLGRLVDKYGELQPDLTNAICDQAINIAMAYQLEPGTPAFIRLVNNITALALCGVEAIHAQDEINELESVEVLV